MSLLSNLGSVAGGLVKNYFGGNNNSGGLRFPSNATYGVCIDIYGIQAELIKNGEGGGGSNATSGGSVPQTSTTENKVASSLGAATGAIARDFGLSSETANKVESATTSAATSVFNTIYTIATSPMVNKATLILPIPVDLNFSYSASWNANQLTALEYFAREWTKAGKSPAAQEQMINNMAQAGLVFGAQEAVGLLGGASAVDRVIGAGKAMGVVLNPYRQLMYDAPQFRSFSFKWQLSPKNKNESEVIDQIIWYLKKHMHPQVIDGKAKDNVFWTNPDFIKISVITDGDSSSPNPWIPLIKDAVITSVVVNYDTKFHKDDSSPSAISLTIDVTETVLYSQEDFGESYSTYRDGGVKSKETNSLSGPTKP